MSSHHHFIQKPKVVFSLAQNSSPRGMSFSVPLTQVALLFQGLAESRRKVDLLAFYPYLHIDEPTNEKELCTVRSCVIVGLESPHLVKKFRVQFSGWSEPRMLPGCICALRAMP